MKPKHWYEEPSQPDLSPASTEETLISPTVSSSSPWWKRILRRKSTISQSRSHKTGKVSKRPKPGKKSNKQGKLILKCCERQESGSSQEY